MWYDEDHKEFGDISYKINKAYCDKHGYDIIRDSHRRVPERTPTFECLPLAAKSLAAKHLPEYEYLVWVDADAYFHIDSPPIHQLLDDYSEFDIILSQDITYHDGSYPSDYINFGVFIVKNTSHSQEILDFCAFDEGIYKKVFNDHLTTEQDLIRTVYRENLHYLQKRSVILPFGFLQNFYEEAHLSNEAADLLSKYKIEKEYIFHLAGPHFNPQFEDKKSFCIQHFSDYYNRYVTNECE
tara:strand:- start:3323 stop:4042 length:720 start_codon:yes stop_codon:yes gene_type:complete